MKTPRILSFLVGALLFMPLELPAAAEVDEALGESETYSEGATLDAPDSAMTGQSISIAWTGPNGAGDFIAIVVPNSEPSDFGVFAKTSEGNPVKITAPDIVGKYEIRYVTGKHDVLASRILLLTKATASVKENGPLVAGGTVEVQWTGPNERGDFIAIVLAGSEGSRVGAMTPTRDGNPAKVAVPTEPGEYEIRYVRGSDSQVLSGTPATVISTEREEQIEQGVGF